jgi:hypothetical protein
MGVGPIVVVLLLLPAFIDTKKVSRPESENDDE